ncbi:MAG: flagellar filament capping protein FliD, partial [Bacteroidota bacterium]
GSFTVNLGGTNTTINYTAGTYSAVMDSIVTQLNAISGITAQKIINGSNVQLQVTVNDNSKYISLGSDTGTLLTELGIANTKEISAAGMVTASVFSPTTTTSQLSITAKQSGYDYRIESLTDQAGSQALASVGLNLGATRQSFAQNAGLDTPGYVYATTQLNAMLQFNGINIERNSNVITDLVSNVTLNLKSVMQATDPTVNVTVQNDATKIKGKIQSFIDTFNDLYKYIKSQTAYTNGTRGVLVGDSNSTALQSMLYSTTTSDVAGLSTTQINSLSKIGITFDINNGLSVTNSTQLDNAISSNLDQVAAVFNSTNGIATVLYNNTTPYLTAATGYIAVARNGFSSAIQNLNDSISSKQTRINSSADSLRKQYIGLQSQLSQLLSMQSYFSSGSSLFG